MQRLKGHDIRLSAQKILQCVREVEERHRRVIALPLHEQVDVAIGTGVPPTDRAEHAEPSHAKLPGKPENLISMRSENVLDAEPVAELYWANPRNSVQL